MTEEDKNRDAADSHPKNGWGQKFVDAWVGVALAFRTEKSFYIHLPIGLGVMALGLGLHVTRIELAILVLAVAVVLVAELFNTAIENLARAVTSDYSLHIKKALDVSAGAVLVASLLSLVVGIVILGPRLVGLLIF